VEILEGMVYGRSDERGSEWFARAIQEVHRTRAQPLFISLLTSSYGVLTGRLEAFDAAEQSVAVMRPTGHLLHVRCDEIDAFRVESEPKPDGDLAGERD
jgi:hypothetical protein